MAPLPDRVLAWLWSVLQTYSQPRVAYNDAASALTQFPTLKPKTAVYTFDNGQTALLLCLSGTVSVDHRGTEYRYPVQIWVPQNYGDKGVGVMCYVDQSPEMIIRPGQHVAQDGRVYHPYLRDWGVYERSTIVAFLTLLREVFAREPPLAARGVQARAQTPQGPATPTLPPKVRPGESSTSAQSLPSATSGPPPLPAKPGQPFTSTPGAHAETNRSGPRDGPPLPPLPPGMQTPQRPSYTGNGHPLGPAPPSYHGQAGPPHAGSPLPHRVVSSHVPQSPVSPVTPQQSTYTAGPSNYRQGSPATQYHPPNAFDTRHAQAPTQHPLQYAKPQTPHYNAPGLPPPNSQPPIQGQRQPHQQVSLAAVPAVKPPAPAVDLLTDPFDISLPTAVASGPAPPIPPNPEKEHLLHLLSETLVAQATQKFQQAQSALTPLTSQHQALLAAQSRLKAELSQLQSLDTALATNEAILHQSLRDCTAVIEASAQLPKPNIDEVLVAPTVAAQQLWNLCADEVAIKEAMYCLQRAVGAGRVSSAEFVRLTRSLARECFLKMALARKVAKGLGLDTQSTVRR